MSDNGEKYVTYKQFIITLVTLIGVLFGGMWSLIQFHQNQPHADAVHQREYERLEQRIVRIEQKLDRLIDLRVQGK